MGVEAVIATQVIDTTSVGRAVMTAANAAAVRSAIGAGTSSFDGAYSSLSGIPSTFAPSSHTHTASAITDFSEAVDDEVATLLVAGTNISITYNDAANTLTIASTAGGLSGTGSVDNAALRADGAGGATLQNSAWIINDNLTASPNNTINHACLEATGGTANVSVSIKPKGSGAFCLSPPDGTATGGNVRGANAVDLQTSRSDATHVASGTNSAVLGGTRCTASGANSVAAGGSTSTASGSGAAVVGGTNGTASNTYSSVFGGEACTASGVYSVVCGGISNTASNTGAAVVGGLQAVADRYGMTANSAGRFAANGDAQRVGFTVRNKTTNNTATTLFLDGSSTRLTIPSGKVASLMCRICGIKSDGSAVANYVRRVVIKNVGGTTSLVGSVETIGTDIEDNASTDVAITADNANDALQINVTGITSETWRWVAVVEGLEIAYGT